MNKAIEEFSKKYDNKIVSILGTDYLIKLCSDKEDERLKECYGYCNKHENIIVITNEGKDYAGKTVPYIKNSIKRTIRHELIHAFLDESGLLGNAITFKGPWPFNEEMVDWFALQSPKIFKLYQELDLLNITSQTKKEK